MGGAELYRGSPRTDQRYRWCLTRHGVNCERTHIVALETGVGASLAASAMDFGADLVVMGCYGHSRLREFILGGASRYFLSEAEIPVLMSH